MSSLQPPVAADWLSMMRHEVWRDSQRAMARISRAPQLVLYSYEGGLARLEDVAQSVSKLGTQLQNFQRQLSQAPIEIDSQWNLTDCYQQFYFSLYKLAHDMPPTSLEVPLHSVSYSCRRITQLFESFRDVHVTVHIPGDRSFSFDCVPPYYDAAHFDDLFAASSIFRPGFTSSYQRQITLLRRPYSAQQTASLQRFLSLPSYEEVTEGGAQAPRGAQVADP